MTISTTVLDERRKTISVVIEDEVLHKIQLKEAQLLTEIAVMLFRQERFTLEQASRFARMNQLQFQRLLASRKISLHYDSEINNGDKSNSIPIISATARTYNNTFLFLHADEAIAASKC